MTKKTKRAKAKTFEPDAMVLIGVQCRNGHRQVVGAECLENHCRCEAEVGISHPIGLYVVWYCSDCPGNTPANEVLVG